MDDVDRLATPVLPDGVPPLAAEDHVCTACGIAYPAVTVDAARAAIALLPGRYAAALRGVPEEALRRRPEPAVWSAIEYLCHVRDVYAVFTIRLHRARTETDPPLESMLNDLRARRFDYAHAELRPVVDQLRAHVTGFLAELDRVGVADWGRPVHRYPGEQRTTLWLARQAAHEGRHHLRDIGGALRTAEQ